MNYFSEKISSLYYVRTRDTKVKFAFICFGTVAPRIQDVTIARFPQTVVAGSTEKISCEVARIKPRASDIYWIIRENRFNGTISSTKLKEEQIYSQVNILNYT